MQDQANNFMHNRNLTMSRQKALTDAGAYRAVSYTHLTLPTNREV